MKSIRVRYFFMACLLTRLALAETTFVPQELFSIPFGDAKYDLGTKRDGERLQLPHDLTIDGLGRFYITDIGKNRVVRYSPAGAYEMSANYPASIRQVFAHGDANGNLWLLVADPARGLHYGVYDPRGKELRAAEFAQYNRFRLHVGDDGQLRAILTTDQKPKDEHLYRFDAQSFFMKPETTAKPSDDHHRIQQGPDRSYYIDAEPGAPKTDAERVSRVTDSAGGPSTAIQGRVIYVTASGDIYTRTSARDIRIYSANGSLKGQLRLGGLSETASGVRFDPEGNIYQLDGIPDRTEEEARKAYPTDARKDPEDRRYTSNMRGMRLIKWERR